MEYVRKVVRRLFPILVASSLRTVFAIVVALVLLNSMVFAADTNVPESTTNDANNTTSLSSAVEGGEDPCDNPTTVGCAQESDQDVGSAGNSTKPLSQVGNPVSLITGNKYQIEKDYNSPASRLQFFRHYNSANFNYNVGFGRGWSSTYATSLRKLGKQGYDIAQGTGQRSLFRESKTDENGRITWHAATPSEGYLWADDEHFHWELPDGRRLSFFGRYLVRIEFPGHQFLKLFYKNRKLVEVSDEAGRLLKFSYYPGKIGLPAFTQTRFSEQPGHLASLTLPDGRTLHYDYDSELNLSRVRYEDGTSREFHYEDEGYTNHLTGITDRNNVRYASWTYNDDGKAISSEHAGGVEHVTIDYIAPAEGQETGATFVTNSLGEVSHYRWQISRAAGQAFLLSSDGPGCKTCSRTNMRYTYSERYQLETATHNTGESTRYVYDEYGRQTDVYTSKPGSAEVHVVHNEYVGLSHFPSLVSKPSVNPEGRHEIVVEYNDDMQPLRISEKGYAPVGGSQNQFSDLSRSTTLSYENGQLSSIDGPRTDVEDISRFEYDQLGRLVRIDLPTGQSISLSEFDEHGRATSFTSGSQSPLSMSYDANGNIAAISMRGESIRYLYDAEGRLTGLIDPNGKTTELQYDNAGRLTKLTDDLGLVSEFTSDTEGRITDKSFYGINGELIRSLSYVFDAEGRLQSANERSSNESTGNNIDETTDYYYDEFGQLVSLTNPGSGEQTDISYDPFGRLSSIANAGGTQAKVSYDSKGQEIGFTDSRNNKTEYFKDDFGRVVALISPDTGTTLYSYDESGNRIAKRNAEGHQFTYQWDAGDRLIHEESPDGVTTYLYHPTNGRLIETSNPNTTEIFAYNDNAQLIEHTRELDGHTLTTGYRYDAKGRISKKLLPDGQTLRYHFHTSGPNIGTLRAITRETLLGLNQETLVGEIDLEKRDGSTGYLSHNGIRTQAQYFPNGDIQSIEVSNTLSLHYTFDDEGNITGINQDGMSQSYFYSAGNLIVANTQLGDFQYQYDAVSNRTSKSEKLMDGTQNDTFYEYSSSGEGNKLLSTSNTTDGVTEKYLYNQAGSPLKAASGLTYRYTAKQRPKEVYKNGALLAEYRYNSFGERIKKVVYNNQATKITYYLYDGHTLTAEVSAEGVVDAQFVYLQDNTPVVKLQNNQSYAIHSDHLGTPQRMTDVQAQLVWDAKYTPYGKATVSLEAVGLNLRLPGQYEDSETGTHYNYYRDYDPATGRYVTSDPIGLKGGVNTYAYLAGNPLGGTDVLGLAEDDKNLIEDNGVKKPVSEASYLAKLKFVLLNSLSVTGEKMRSEVEQMIQPENLLKMALMMGAITALQAIPVVNGIVDAALLGWAWWNFGKAGANFLAVIIKTGIQIARAKSIQDLCGLSAEFGNSLADLGTAALDILDRGGKRVNKLADKHSITEGKIPTLVLASLPRDYKFSGKNIVGPQGGIYRPTGKDIGGYEVYQNNGSYYTFRDGKKHKEDPPARVKNVVIGLVGEQKTTREMEAKGWSALGKTQNGTESIDRALPGYQGQSGIDGIFSRTNPNTGKTEYVIVETKATTSADPNKKLALNTLKDNETKQMSKEWILGRLDPEKSGLSETEYNELRKAFDSGEVKLVKAEVRAIKEGGTDVDPNSGNIEFKELEFSGRRDVVEKGAWSP